MVIFKNGEYEVDVVFSGERMEQAKCLDSLVQIHMKQVEWIKKLTT